MRGWTRLRSRPAAGAAERGAGRATSASTPTNSPARTASPCWPATACRRGRADRAGLCRPPVRPFRRRNSATAAPACWARSSGATGSRRDIQLKGSGPTPFSRGGRRPRGAGPGAARIPDQRGDGGARRADNPDACRGDHRRAGAGARPVLPGAVLTRVAASHIRVGTFQYFAARGDAEAVRLLADYAIARHYPDAAGGANTLTSPSSTPWSPPGRADRPLAARSASSTA